MSIVILLVVTLLAQPILIEGGQQHYVPDNLYSTAERVLSYGIGENDLYDSVVMVYDCIDDASWEACKEQPWRPPMQYYIQHNYWSLFVNPSSCLGVGGPLGPVGVLSNFGPLGKNLSTYNANWLSGNFDGSCEWCKSMEDWYSSLRYFKYGDPLGMDGPLGENGPLSTTEIYSTMYHLNEPIFLANNFPTNLDITGVWGILGPLSILGPFGALGPLGVLYQSAIYSTINPATHMYDGQYRDPNTGEIVRKLSMQYSTDVFRVYDLFELYPPATAIDLGDSHSQDSSFAVESYFRTVTQVDNYKFCSNYNQTISALVIPVMHIGDNVYDEIFSDFDISVSDENNQLLMRSASSSSSRIFSEAQFSKYQGYIDWIVFRAARNQCFTANISSQFLSPTNSYYRMFIVGDGFLEGEKDHEIDVNLFNHHNIFGTHQAFYE